MVGTVKRIHLCHHAKFRWNHSNHGRDIWVSILCEFGLKKPIKAPLGGGGLGHSSPHDVNHRPNPKKCCPWAEPHHLSHKAWITDARFELGVWTRKKRQDRKKSQKGYISPICGEVPIKKRCQGAYNFGKIKFPEFSRFCKPFKQPFLYNYKVKTRSYESPKQSFWYVSRGITEYILFTHCCFSSVSCSVCKRHRILFQL